MSPDSSPKHLKHQTTAIFSSRVALLDLNWRFHGEGFWVTSHSYILIKKQKTLSFSTCGCGGETLYKKKNDISIDFLRCWEEKMVSIFRLRKTQEVRVSLGPNRARSEIYTNGSLDISRRFGQKKMYRAVGLAGMNSPKKMSYTKKVK